MVIIRRCRTRRLPSKLRMFFFIVALKFHLLHPRRQVAQSSDSTYILPAIVPSLSPVGNA